MSIKIHHGPAGSYKTSGAVQDDLIPAALAGRHVITNVRGLNDRGKIYDALGGVPDSFEILYLPTSDHPDSAQNREYLAKFFHWAPVGAFLLIDEAQFIFPKSWRDADLKKLEYPGGAVAAGKDGRPPDFRTAFDMHRHYNWDIVMTTTNINKIRDDIRGVTDAAYRHRNAKVVGIGGRYFETMHQAEDNGATGSNQMSSRLRKIEKRVWGLYESTATGVISDTKAGLSIFKSPKFLLLLVLLFAFFGYFALSPPVLGPRPVTDKAASPAKNPVVPPPDGVKTAQNSPVKSSVSGVVADVPDRESGLRSSSSVVQTKGQYDDYDFRIVSSYSDNETHRVYVRLLIENDQEEVIISASDLPSMGYNVKFYNPCLVAVWYADQVQAKRFVSCTHKKRRTPHVDVASSLESVVPVARERQ